MTRMIRYMPAVAAYRERLATLQGTWDSLALLSHLSEEGMNLSATRQAFETLAGDLIKHLEAETHKKAVVAARARAQMAIDVLVRNLFERTADVGFLAADPSLRRFAQQCAAGNGEARDARAVAMRLAEYVTKYSVYHNVILISPEGEVLAQLEGGAAPARTHDPLLRTTLTVDQAYVETFRASDLVPDSRRALVYSHRVVADGQVLGVLCLCFRFEDECEAIFRGLRADGDWSVLSLLSADNEVIATSDAHQLPLGVKVATGERDSGDIVRFAGREFLAITRTPQSYQGYAGPGWRGHVMVPLDRAFEFEGQSEGAQGRRESGFTDEVLTDLRASATTFSSDLRLIPQHADAVQRDLNRSVWNGSIRLSLHKNSSSAFAKALLREISNMGRRTQEIFERSIQDLHETVLSSVLHDSRFMASLAMEIQARNLYERANDCRWWALDATLIGRLAGTPECTDEAAAHVLTHINRLYTVYHGIVLLDAQRRIVASSRAEHAALIGQCVEESWAVEALSLASTQSYSVSEFAPSVLYEGTPGLIYAAAVRSPEGRTVGVVGVVFDTAPQLRAMLRDALPRDAAGEPLPGCVAAFLDSRLQLMAATVPDFQLDGLDLEWVRRVARDGDARVVRIGLRYFAVGVRPDTGYREYRGIGGCAVTLIPVGEVPHRRAAQQIPEARIARVSGTKRDLAEFATFAIGESWYALPAFHVIEAIDAKGLQPLPSRQSWCAGLIMFEGEPIAAADVGALLGSKEVGSGSVVVVLRAPSSGKPIGILADALGQICEIPRERLLPIGDPERVLTPFAIEPEDASGRLVLVMNPQRLEALIRGESQANAA